MRPNSQLQLMAELALIHSLPLVAGYPQKSRLAGLLAQVVKLVERDYNRKLERATQEEQHHLAQTLGDFGMMVKWETSPKFLPELLGFCRTLAFRNERINSAIGEKIDLVDDYLVAGGHPPVKDYVGSEELKIWDAMFSQDTILSA